MVLILLIHTTVTYLPRSNGSAANDDNTRKIVRLFGSLGK